MGVKGESSNRAKPVATDDQMRLARLTLEGNSVEEDPANIQRLIKRVIETTRCTQARAELALYDNDNDLAAAIDYILEHGSEIESWTEQKSKKDKKKEEEEKRPARGQPSTRGRGGFSDRGGRGRGRGDGMSSRGASRGGSTSGRGRGAPVNSTGPRPALSKPSVDEAVTKAVDTDSVDDVADWKSGPMVFHRSEDTPSTVPASNVPAPAAQPPNASPAPISFAAVAAAAAKKDLKRQQPPQPTNSVPIPEQTAQAPAEFHHDEAVPSVSPAAVDQSTSKDVFYSEPSVAHPISQNDGVPGVASTSDADDGEVLPTTPSLSPAIQANWTSQLKNDLGIGIASPTRQQQFTSVQSLTSAPAGVEFVTATIPPGLSDYHFGFVDAPQNTEIAASAASVANPNPDVLFSSARTTTNATGGSVPAKANETERPLNGDFSLKSSPPISHSYGQQQQQQHNTRSLSYADPSSVSYAPTTQQDRGVGSGNKPPAPIPHPPQQSAAHQAPQQMFPTQMPYGSYPYMNMNMYSPVTGVRAEDQYAALYAASMPFGMGVDLSAILPPTTPMSQAGANQQHPGSTQHRSDTHNLVDMNKFASGNTRDGSGQQPSNVAPPPGFANPSFMPQPGLSSLFLQQQFPPHPYSFMMPNVGSGRQMYPQEDDRKSYDKMGGAKQAQATPPQHYHNGGYLNSGLNKKPYNWNS
ncbi:hypothetical protein Q1695_010370 [Nippostrongylus brasiliensis]|nr:hypothetical protein Q1695_010370 [Nippostrongylus brasiliensis]